MKSSLVLLLPLITAACASSTMAWTGREVRPANDLPTAFVTEDGEPAVESCRSPLIDPRDQTRIRMVRAGPIGGVHQGDYEVPAGRYGLGDRELLRVNCETGEPLGIVQH